MFLYPVVRTLGLDEGLDSSFRPERGLFHTAVRLTIAPGRMIRDYLGGRTVPYTHPIVYLVVSFAAFALLNAWTGAVTGAGDHRDFVVFGILLIAAVSRLLFWQARLNYAEHLILTIYLFGHVTFFLTFVLIPIHAAGTSRTATFFVFAALALAVAYFPWAYSRVFDRRPVLSAAGGLATLVGGVVLWFYGTGAIMYVLRARGII